MANLKHMNNDMAVSPIVATLVLIIVAVIGAVAVGTIMGAFSQDVSKQVTANGAGDAANTIGDIIIAGSTTVQPASEALAKVYMDAHPGVKITVQGGGSGAGVTAAESGLVDIGASSSAVDTVVAHPSLESYTIGGSAVVVIAHTGVTETDVTGAELLGLYKDGTAIGTITSAVQRSEASGTEENFAKFINHKGSDGQLNTTSSVVTSAVGNPGVIAAVKATSGSVGFSDYGMVATDTGVKMLGIDISGTIYNPTTAKITASLKGTANGNTTYVKDLTRPLIYVTKDTQSSPIVKDFIQFAQGPGAMDTMTASGYIPYMTFA